LRSAGIAITGIAAEIGQLAGKTDPVSNAIRERLTGPDASAVPSRRLIIEATIQF
jgi:hypothetical protein